MGELSNIDYLILIRPGFGAGIGILTGVSIALVESFGSRWRCFFDEAAYAISVEAAGGDAVRFWETGISI